MLAIKTILHPTDFSERSDNAFRLACALASDYGAQLVIVHVVGMPLIFGEGVVLPSDVIPQDELQEKLNDLAVSDSRVDVARRLEEGDPATEILRVAAISHADLIVMGTHGRSGLSRLLMGSVAEEVLRNATCPVVTVTTPMAERVPDLGIFHEESVRA